MKIELVKMQRVVEFFEKWFQNFTLKLKNKRESAGALTDTPISPYRCAPLTMSLVITTGGVPACPFVRIFIRVFVATSISASVHSSVRSHLRQVARVTLNRLTLAWSLNPCLILVNPGKIWQPRVARVTINHPILSCILRIPNNMQICPLVQEIQSYPLFTPG